MSRDETLPFPVGSTFYGADTTVINQTENSHLEGKEYLVEDEDLSNGTIGSTSSRSGRLRRLRIVRNMNATTLNAKEIAKLKINGSTKNVMSGQVDGLCASYSDKGYPVDEYLGSSGCPQYDLCYVVVDGYAKCKTDSAGDTNFGIGDVLVPGAGTAGRVIQLDGTVTGANLFACVFNAIGRATEAVNATSTDVVVDVGAHRR